MGNYKALPFATYDLAVYLPGGAIIIVLAQYCLVTLVGAGFLPDFQISGQKLVDDVILAILWLSASYLCGHLGAFLSSYAVERFVHNALGYPSDIWIETEEYVNAGVPANQFLKNKFAENIKNYRWRLSSVITIIFLFPLWLLFFSFYIFRPIAFYVPKLPERILADVQRAYRKTGSSVKIEYGSRWEKIVEHFVANNCPTAYLRMYNYLVIYGALRLLSFIAISVSWIILIKSGYSFFEGNWHISGRRVIILFVSSLAGYMAMIAFAKFNRRYFEESIMALLLANVAETSRTSPSARILRSNRAM